MSENQEEQTKPGEKFRYLKALYKPRRTEAGRDLEKSGLDPKSGAFHRARARVARGYLEKELKGEIDQLTGLLNRSGFERRLAEEAKRAKRLGQSATIFFFDLNWLKQINDQQGYEAGDQLLKSVALTLQENSRLTDVLVRWGGDEFAVILPNTDIDKAQNYWERLNANLEKGGINIGAGLAIIDTTNQESVENSCVKARESMQEAKAISKAFGKNHLITYYPDS